MSLREALPNKKSLQVTIEYDKGPVMQISIVLRTFTILLLEASSETRLFRHLSDYVFGVRIFENTKSIEGHLFLFKILKINRDFKNAAKKFFDSEIIASELVSLNFFH